MEILPDPKLVTKMHYTLATTVGSLFLPGLILVLILVAAGKVDFAPAMTVLLIITGIFSIILWGITIPLYKLWVKNLKFVIEEDRIIIHKGILSKIQQNIPYRAVTDFMLHRSLYDRFLGIGSVNIQTAGQGTPGSAYEGSLVGLVDYEKIHQELRNRLAVFHPMAAGPVATSEAAPIETSVKALQAILVELQAIRKAVEK